MVHKRHGPKITYSKSLKEKSRKLRNDSTPAEKHFWNALRKMPFYGDLTINRQKPIAPYIADFYCHQLRLVIEIDGPTHGEENRPYDSKRTKYFESQGLRVARFTNRDVLENIEGVMEQVDALVEEVKKNPPSPL